MMVDTLRSCEELMLFDEKPWAFILKFDRFIIELIEEDFSKENACVQQFGRDKLNYNSISWNNSICLAKGDIHALV